jgi:chemotaxis protein methyltransferase CheR
MTTLATSPRVTPKRECAPDPHLYRIRDLVYQVAGIFQPDNKLRLLEDRCGRRMKEIGANNLKEYFECLTIRPIRQAELVKLLNEITIGETCFFRNQSQLNALRSVVLPRIIAATSRLPIRRIRIWSAGCSTGEEPYTFSMIVLEEMTNLLKGWTVEILATDLNERSLEQANAGVYGNYAVRNLTPHYRQKYFAAEGDRLKLNAEVKSKVNFKHLNLLDDARMTFLKGMDIISCQNVLIYFDLMSKRRVIQHFYNNLLPHGYLFLGHSESLYGVNNDFRLVHLPSTTAYVKADHRELPE